MSDRKHVTVYTRGIASPRRGGYGAVLLCDGRCKELSGGAVGASNNRMDLLGAVESLRSLRFPCQVTLYNTNSYLTEAMSKGWARRWRAHGWRTSEGHPAAHADLWDALLDLCAVHEVEFVWLPLEPGLGEYRRCDELAREVTARQAAEVIQGRA